MFTKLLSKKIQQKLKARERALSWRTNQANEFVDSADLITPSDVINRSTFVRMCSNKTNILENRIIVGGLFDKGKKMKFGYSELYSKTKNQGDRPTAGIKNIEVSYLGDFKGLRKATVNWSVNSNDELNELTPHFLALGQTVILDWGWVSKKSKGLTVDLGVAPFITFDSEGSVEVKQDIFQNPQQTIQAAGGDYDAMGGTVSNFEYSLRPDGGYDCVTYITALGSTLYKKPLDKSGNKTDLASDSTSSEETVETNFDGLINSLINLKELILYDILGIEYTKWFFNIIDKGQKRNRVDKFANDENNDNKVIYHKGSGIYSTGAITNSKKNPQIIYMYRYEGNDDVFVKWGWMEDQLLNRYVSYVGGEDREVKLTVRSIDTVLYAGGDKQGEPIPIKDLSDEDKERYDLKDIPEEHLGKVLKKPTLIRNSKLLYPIDPLKFFNVERLPFITNVDTGDIAGDVGHSFIQYFEMITAIKRMFFSTEGEAGKDKMFQNDDDLSFGKLRDMWVNIKEIQSAFGVNQDGSVSPVGTLETGIDNLCTSLNSNFHNYWDFALVADPFDSTNLKVIDKRTTTIGGEKYTTYEGGDEDGKASHKVQTLGIYKFPSFKIGSIVKSQNMSFKIPDSMQLSILYGSNTSSRKYKPVSHINNSDLMRLFLPEKQNVQYFDRHLVNLETPYYEKNRGRGVLLPQPTEAQQNAEEIAERATFFGVPQLNNPVVVEAPTTVQEDEDSQIVQSKIGSYDTNPNSKIGLNINVGPININPKTVWWKRWTGTNVKEPEEKDEGLSDRKPIVKFSINANSDIVTLEEKTITRTTKIETDTVIDFSGALYTGTGNTSTNTVTSKYTVVDEFEEKLGPNKTQFYNFDFATHSVVMKDDAATVITNFLNKNNPSLIIPTELSLEVDGIGGIMPGDIIQTDYIQPQYNTNLYKGETLLGPFTYFQIVESNQKVDSTGWVTEINTKMRLNDINIDGETTIKDDPVKNEAEEGEQENLNTEDIDTGPPPEKPVTTVVNIVNPGTPHIDKVVGEIPFAKTYNEVVVENTFEPATVATIPKKELPKPPFRLPFDDKGRPIGQFVQGSTGKFDKKHTPTKLPGPNIKPREERKPIRFTTLFGKVHSKYGPTAIFYWHDSWGPNQQPSGFYPAWRKTDDRYSRTLWFISKGELSRDDVKTVGSTIREIGEYWAQKEPDFREFSRGNYFVVGNGKNDYPGPKYIIDNVVRKLPISNYPSPNTSNTIRIYQSHPATGRTGFLDVDVTDIKG